ncbi:MAG: glycosyltransferase [Chloroflexi bacterium]|nr:glycosyltransferase [Chloroflexota bacterium]
MTRQKTLTSRDIQAFVARPQFDPAIIGSRDPAYPRISVIVPSYNQGQFLERTILSILNQNYPNTEIIVMDGGSQDGSVAVIEKYAEYISDWSNAPDKGQSNAINQGFAKATGDLVGWQNSDDLYLPGFFRTIAESFQAYPNAQLFCGNIYLIDENDQITWATKYTPFSVSHLIYLEWNLSSQAVFIRRSMVERVGPLREDVHVGFDWDWFIRIGKLLKPSQSVLHRAYGGGYRIHAASKFSAHAQPARWRIEADILRSHNVPVNESLPYSRQAWWQTPLLRLRMLAYIALLYKPIPLLQHLRPLILRLLAQAGTLCVGFE